MSCVVHFRRVTCEKKYGINGDEGQFESMAQDLRNGRLNHLLLLSRLQAYVKFSSNKQMVPLSDVQNTGSRRPIEEEEPKLEQADDIKDWKDFYRNGPPEKDLDRLISGDLLQNVYREEMPRTNFKNLKGREVTILIFDISSSMQSNNKYIVQGALKAAFMDYSQIKVIQQQGQHVVIAIPFGSGVGSPEQMTTLKQAYDYFARVLESPISGGSGTEITNAIVKALDLVKTTNENGEATLDRANILFLTDGADNFSLNHVIAKRKELDPKIDLWFTTINIGDGNEQFKAAQTDPRASEAFGKYNYRHIPSAEIDRLINQKLSLEILQEAAADANIGAAMSNEIQHRDLTQFGFALSQLENAIEAALRKRSPRPTNDRPEE